MPDLSNCKYIGGKLYCWDTQEDDFVLIQKEKIRSPDTHKKVVAAFMRDTVTNISKVTKEV
jgi:hypothetical protein